MMSKLTNHDMLDLCFSYHINGGMSDEDYSYLLWAMECDGIPVELLEPIREYFRQPVADREKLKVWCNNAIPKP